MILMFICLLFVLTDNDDNSLKKVLSMDKFLELLFDIQLQSVDCYLFNLSGRFDIQDSKLRY